MIWQEAERERIGVEAETIRLETLRHRSLEQLGRVYGHLESVLDEVRAGIGRVEEEQEDLDEATAAAAARLGVEPPASSPEESPRFPDLRPQAPADGDDGMLSATRPGDPDLSLPEAADQPEQPPCPRRSTTAPTGRRTATPSRRTGTPRPPSRSWPPPPPRPPSRPRPTTRPPPPSRPRPPPSPRQGRPTAKAGRATRTPPSASSRSATAAPSPAPPSQPPRKARPAPSPRDPLRGPPTMAGEF